MKKEDLMKIEGMTEAIAEAVAKASAEELKEFIPKTRFDEVNEAKKNAEELVKARDKQLEDVKKSTGDNEELKKQIEELQETNKAAKAEYEANIKRVQRENTDTLLLAELGAKNAKAVIALLDAVDDKLEGDDYKAARLAQIKEIQKSDSYLFETKAEPHQNKPTGATPANSGSHTPGAITKEQFDRMGYKQRVELFNNNRELYDSLSGTNN